MSDRRTAWWDAKAKTHKDRSKIECLRETGRRKPSYKKAKRK